MVKYPMLAPMVLAAIRLYLISLFPYQTTPKKSLQLLKK